MRMILIGALVVTVACEDKKPEPISFSPSNASPPAFVPTHDTGDPWWCAAVGSNIATCDDVLAKCDGRRRDMSQVDESQLTHTCWGAKAVACVRYRRKLDGTEERNCYSEISVCMNARDMYLASRRQDVDLIDDCVKR